jgi:hypothetical protein
MNGEIGALREVLAQEAVGVLVGPRRNGLCGSAEVDFDAGVDESVLIFRTASIAVDPPDLDWARSH